MYRRFLQNQAVKSKLKQGLKQLPVLCNRYVLQLIPELSGSWKEFLCFPFLSPCLRECCQKAVPDLLRQQNLSQGL